MAVRIANGFQGTSEVISSIMNCVCPECGGRMGGRGEEFKCQGECRRDWREIWNQVLAVGR